MRHTPGPWYYDPAYGYVRTLGRDATVLEASELFPNQHANGQLAAAAPELLATLEAALPALVLLGNYIGNEWDGGGGIEPFNRCGLIAHAKGAIEQARKQPNEAESDRTNIDRCATALGYLVAARGLLQEAGAVKTLERVRLAISSAKGAVRHARLEPYRTERQAAARGGK